MSSYYTMSFSNSGNSASPKSQESTEDDFED